MLDTANHISWLADVLVCQHTVGAPGGTPTTKKDLYVIPEISNRESMRAGHLWMPDRSSVRSDPYGHDRGWRHAPKKWLTPATEYYPSFLRVAIHCDRISAGSRS